MPSYPCNRCNQIFETHSALSNHKRTHQATVTTKSLHNHEVKFFRDPVSGLFRCTCGTQTSRAKAIRRHLSSTNRIHSFSADPTLPPGPKQPNIINHTLISDSPTPTTDTGQQEVPPRFDTLTQEEDLDEPSDYEVSNRQSIEEYFNLKYLDKHGIIVCLQCVTGINPLHLVSHLQKQHNFTGPIQRTLDEYLDMVEPNPVDTVVNPPANGPPIIPLKVYNGFVCHRCQYACVTDYMMKKHSMKCNPNEALYGRSAVQSFFSGVGKIFFAVKRAHVGLQSHDELTQDIINQAHQLYETFHERRKKNTMLGNYSASEQSPYLERMGWLSHFAGTDVLKVRAHATKLESRHQTTMVTEAVHRVFSICRQYFSQAHDGTKRWMSSASSVEWETKPFDLIRSKKTLVEERCWVNMIIYIISVNASPATGPAITEAHSKLFFMTGEQLKWLTTIKSTLLVAASVDDLEPLIFGLSVSLISQHCQEGDTFCLMNHVTSVLGIDPHSGSFRTASQYSKDLATLLYLSRLFIMRQAYEEARNGHLQQYDIFVELHHKYLTPTALSPVAEIINLLAWIRKFGADETQFPDIMWNINTEEEAVEGDSLIYRGDTIYVDRLRTMLMKQIKKARDILEKEFGIFSDKLYTLEMIRQVKDNLTELDAGYSFLSDPRNEKIFNTDNQLDLMFENGPLQGQLLRVVNSKIVWLTHGIHLLIRSAERFLEHMLLAIHGTGGQPARATEIMQCRWANSIYAHRNMFICNGYLMFVTSYYKNIKTIGSSKFIPRFADPDVVPLFIAYLHRVLPLIQYLANIVARDPNENTTPKYFFFADHYEEQWDSTKLTSILSRESSLFFQDTSIGTIGYRHIIILISWRYMRQPFEDDGEEDKNDFQAATADRIYGVRADILRNLSEHSISIFSHISILWHRFLQSPQPSSHWQKSSGLFPQHLPPQLEEPITKRQRITELPIDHNYESALPPGTAPVTSIPADLYLDSIAVDVEDDPVGVVDRAYLMIRMLHGPTA